jgi:hypothetical protein
MFGRVADSYDDYNCKELKQQQAASQADAFTISTATASLSESYSLTLPHASQLDALPAPESFLSAPIVLSSDPRCPTQVRCLKFIYTAFSV